MSQGIYKITNLITDDCYIGQSVNIENRWRGHMSASKKENKQFEYPLYRAFRKYETSNFKFEILELVPNRNNLLEKEIYYYEMFKPMYNQKAPDESRLKGTEVLMINRQTKEILKYFRSMRDASRKINLSNSFIKRVCERKKDTSKDFTFVYKKDFNESWKPKTKGKTPTKKVLQIDIKNNEVIDKHESLREASRKTGINVSTIVLCCKGKFKQSGGYIWRYADEK